MPDCRVSEFLAMQHELCEKHKWGPRTPESGHSSLLWSIGEIGEMVEILKKKGHNAIMDDPAVRAHFVEETADVFMYLYDMMECFGISAEEFSAAYTAKWNRNMGRTWAENRMLYEDMPGEAGPAEPTESTEGERK